MKNARDESNIGTIYTTIDLHDRRRADVARRQIQHSSSSYPVRQRQGFGARLEYLADSTAIACRNRFVGLLLQSVARMIIPRQIETEPNMKRLTGLKNIVILDSWPENTQ